jgi:primary-amine oxidase
LAIQPNKKKKIVCTHTNPETKKRTKKSASPNANAKTLPIKKMKSFGEGCTGPTHPLDPLTPSELRKVVNIVIKSFEDGENASYNVDMTKLRFETIELYEPPKSVVRNFDSSASTTSTIGDRSARASTFLVGGGVGVYRMVVNLTQSKVVSSTHLPKVRPMIQLDEFIGIEEAVKRDQRVIEACAKRGITNIDLLCVGK